LEKKKSLIVEHDFFFFWKLVPNGVSFGQGEDFKLTTELSENAVFLQPSNQKQLKGNNTAYVNECSFAFKIKLCVSQVTETKFCMKTIRIFLRATSKNTPF